MYEAFARRFDRMGVGLRPLRAPGFCDQCHFHSILPLYARADIVAGLKSRRALYIYVCVCFIWCALDGKRNKGCVRCDPG